LLKIVKVKVESPAAYRYIFNDELFLLKQEKELFAQGFAAVNTLVDDPEPPAPITIETPPLHFNYQGNNLKNILILIYYPGVMDASHLAALESTFGRKGLSLDDIALLNISGCNNCTIDDLLAYFKPDKILVLGRSTGENIFTGLPFNQHTSYQNIPVIITFAFGDMMNDNAAKKVFWEQVKNF
jgi:hypothetical protein